jgi:hypothetical protein
METVKLTVRLPKGDLELATGVIHSAVEKITGLIPPDVDIDAKAEYREHVLDKYG